MTSWSTAEESASDETTSSILPSPTRSGSADCRKCIVVSIPTGPPCTVLSLTSLSSGRYGGLVTIKSNLPANTYAASQHTNNSPGMPPQCSGDHQSMSE